MKNRKISFILIILTLLIANCRDQCRITGEYVNYSCPENFDNYVDYLIIKNIYTSKDSCTQKFQNIGYNNEGCAIVINDSADFVLFEPVNIDPESIDFINQSLVIIEFQADLGSSLRHKEFICINRTEKKYLVRLQYEIEDQCAGSGIGITGLDLGIVLP